MVGDKTEEVDEEARLYSKDIDFAFFVVNFNYTKQDYESLTPREKAFIMKAWEDKLVSDTTYARNSHLNAIGNANRKKNSRFIDLWTKPQDELNKEIAENNLKIIENMETDKSWVDKIYKANGRRRING